MKWRWWRTADEMADAFAESRLRATDDSFIADCVLPDNDLARETALAVRRSVAAYGMVESDFINAGDRYPGELCDLSGWDSLDFMDWLFRLEKELDEIFPPEAHASLRTPFTVNDLVHMAYNYRSDKLKSKSIPKSQTGDHQD